MDQVILCILTAVNQSNMERKILHKVRGSTQLDSRINLNTLFKKHFNVIFPSTYRKVKVMFSLSMPSRHLGEQRYNSIHS